MNYLYTNHHDSHIMSNNNSLYLIISYLFQHLPAHIFVPETVDLLLILLLLPVFLIHAELNNLLSRHLINCKIKSPNIPSIIYMATCPKGRYSRIRKRRRYIYPNYAGKYRQNKVAILGFKTCTIYLAHASVSPQFKWYASNHSLPP